MVTWLTVVLSAFALVIASAALYLTTRRRADIRLACASPNNRWCEGPRFEGEALRVPQSLDVPFVAANVGARRGVLESVEFVDLVYEGAEPPLWATIEAKGEALPRALEAGSLVPVRVVGELRGPPARSGKASAERVRGATSVQVTVRWTFVRMRGPVSRLLRRGGQRVTRTGLLTLDCRLYREEVLSYWRARQSWRDLLSIAERRASMRVS